jgi:hypothetical protein
MTTTKWSEVRRSKVPAEQEAALEMSGRALRDAIVAFDDLRAQRGVTQVVLAEKLGRSQGNISDLEHREDLYLSTLRAYVEALGGELEITAVFPEQRLGIAIGEPG